MNEGRFFSSFRSELPVTDHYFLRSLQSFVLCCFSETGVVCVLQTSFELPILSVGSCMLGLEANSATPLPVSLPLVLSWCRPGTNACVR